jgi:V/A-type H+/Na+-transporting ATPase subunit D
MRIRVPPGRGGRLWLRHRIEVGQRAADLLDHKRRELSSELRRLHTVMDKARVTWTASVADATRRMSGVDAAGGSPLVDIAVATDSGRAGAEIEWQTVMGVHYPVSARVELPVQTPLGGLPGGAALSAARDSYRRATRDAIAVAAAEAAFGRIQAELKRTSRTLRALELRAIPSHQEALAKLELRLDESEREDIIRVRWVTRETGTAGGG